MSAATVVLALLVIGSGFSSRPSSRPGSSPPRSRWPRACRPPSSASGGFDHDRTHHSPLRLVVLFSILAILAKDLIKSAISLAVASLLLGILFFRMGAPYAGVFEISVVAGLITVLFMLTIALTKAERRRPRVQGRQDRLPPVLRRLHRHRRPGHEGPPPQDPGPWPARPRPGPSAKSCGRSGRSTSSASWPSSWPASSPSWPSSERGIKDE